MQLQNVLYFLVWGGLFFLMMRMGCGAHVMGHRHARGGRGDGQRQWLPPDQAVDPVCGRTIATATAKTAVHAGHAYYFCSADCRSAFEADPARFAGAEGSSRPGGHHHGC